MINLPDKAVEALEKVMNSKEEFEVLLGNLAQGNNGRIALPMSIQRMVSVHSGLLLHLVANLVEAQDRIGALEGQIAILRDDVTNLNKVSVDLILDKEDNSDGNGTNEQDDNS